MAQLKWPRRAATAAGRPFEAKYSVVAGAAINTNIAISGIVPGSDQIQAVIRLDRDATAANIDIADVTSETNITSRGNIQLTTTNTTGDRLLVIWAKRH